jgi:hypothetical protein
VILKELIERLEKEDPDLVLPIGWHDAHSYRGDYSQLGLEPRENVAVADCLSIVRQALGWTYGGYKGGDYTMHEYTDCYLAEWGDIGEEIGHRFLDLNIAAAKAAR